MPDRTSKRPVCTNFLSRKIFPISQQISALGISSVRLYRKASSALLFFSDFIITLSENHTGIYAIFCPCVWLFQKSFEYICGFLILLMIKQFPSIIQLVSWFQLVHFQPAFFDKFEDSCPDLSERIFDVGFLYLSKKCSLLALSPHELFRSTGNFRKF